MRIEMLLGALGNVSAWIVGYLLMRMLSPPPNAEVYGIISGWFLALYIAAKLSSSITAAILSYAVYLFAFITAAMLGIGFFYKDVWALTENLQWLAIIALLQSAFFASPILLNTAVDSLFRLKT